MKFVKFCVMKKGQELTLSQSLISHEWFETIVLRGVRSRPVEGRGFKQSNVLLKDLVQRLTGEVRAA